LPKFEHPIAVIADIARDPTQQAKQRVLAPGQVMP
jgi:hypothetical protein